MPKRVEEVRLRTERVRLMNLSGVEVSERSMREKSVEVEEGVDESVDVGVRL